MSKVEGPQHPLLGAYVVGRLDADENAAVREHLDGCAECRDELAALESVKRAMDEVPADLVLEELERDLDDMPAVADDLVLTRTLRQIRAESGRAESDLAESGPAESGPAESGPVTGGSVTGGSAQAGPVLAGAAKAARERRMRRPLAVAAAVLLLGTGAAAGAVVGRATAPLVALSPSPSSAPSGAPTPSGTSIAFAPLAESTDAQTGIGLTVRYADAVGWVRLQVRVSGAPAGAMCRLYAVARDGRREVAGSWVIARPGTGARPVEVAAAIPRSDLSRLELESADGQKWVTVAL